MRNTIRITLLLCIITIAGTSKANDIYSAELMHLLKELSRSKEDTGKVKLLIDIGQEFEKINLDTALKYFKQAGALSRKLNYNTGSLRYISNYTEVLSMQNKYSEALLLNLQSIPLALKFGNQSRLSYAYSNTANSYIGLGVYDKAIDNFLKAAFIAEQNKLVQEQANIYANIVGVYYKLNTQNQAGYKYGLKAIALSKIAKDTLTLVTAYVNTGLILTSMKLYDKAMIMYERAEVLCKVQGYERDEVTCLNNMNFLRYKKLQFNLLKDNAQRTLVLATKLEMPLEICTSYIDLSQYYFSIGDYTATKVYLEKALAVANKNNLAGSLSSIYIGFSYLELSLKNINGLYKYREKADSVSDIENAKYIQRNIQQAEAKYSLNKKEAEIMSLNRERSGQQKILKQRQIINWSLAGVIIITLLTGFLFFRNAAQKRKLLLSEAALKEQKLRELETEKQLLIAQSELKGQEEERKRLAKDLHDGLGGILSSTKYSFSNMKNNLIISEETASAFEHGMGMLDKSIQELRRVAHNMMPEALIKFGLGTALDDFCNTINQSGAVKINYQSFDLDDESVPPQKANIIYRVIQELVNNILKHADAKDVLVQVVKKGNAVSISVEDDGKGFDTNILKNTTGIGYLNLQNRVAFLKASMDIISDTGKGTSVNIEIPDIAANY